MRNRFTPRNQWFTETIETICTSGLTLIISTIRVFKTFTAEFGFKEIPFFVNTQNVRLIYKSICYNILLSQ
ncbi:MAG: hypothetical protein LCH44_05305 [Bacteroidetes bacterium]|nr:hypothetical protein [Bacteroidota bacterium]